jgi:hypothetical protein
MADTKAEPTPQEKDDLEFSFDMRRGEQSAHVTVNSRSTYTKTFSFANKLLSVLRTIIPFPYTEKTEPELHVLGGQRVKGMLSVEMGIDFNLPYEEARIKLENAGFTSPTEFILG